MPPDLTCPVCQHLFPAPEGADAPSPCPRCGAALSRTEVRPAQGDIQATPPGPAALATTVCPACGKSVPELCLLCPHCEEPLAERHRVRRPGPEGRGWAWPPYVVWPLRAVGIGGVLFCLLVPLVALLAGGPPAKDAAFVFLVVGVLVAAAVAYPWLAGRRSERARAWVQALGTLMAGLGCFILGMLAAVLYMVAVCAASGSGF